jgi:hypothetical protein
MSVARFPSLNVLLTTGYDPEDASAQDTIASELKVLRKRNNNPSLPRLTRTARGPSALSASTFVGRL